MFIVTDYAALIVLSLDMHKVIMYIARFKNTQMPTGLHAPPSRYFQTFMPVCNQLRIRPRIRQGTFAENPTNWLVSCLSLSG